MAALQKIRSKGTLLLIAIGVGLFAFIAEEFFRSMETTSNIGKMQVGEVYGEKLSVQEYQNMVDEYAEVMKFQYGRELNSSEMDQLRDQVWNMYVQQKIFEHEADELGLQVTDAEVQNALREGTAQSLGIIRQFFSDQTGRFDVTALQNFLKQYKQMAAQAAAMDPAQLETINGVYRMWLFAEKELRSELLSRKIGGFLQNSFLSNPIVAKMEFDDRNTRSEVQLACLPYTAIPDKDVKVSDEELKAKYEQVKEIFLLPEDAIDLKYIDVAVTASAADRKALEDNMQKIYAKLKDTTDVAPIVNSSKSQIHYIDAAVTKNFFASVPDVSAAIDSMAVGSTKAPYYNGTDNTLNIVKLVAKVQAPDSVLCRIIAGSGTTPEATKKSADSIANALNGGANFAELSKKYANAQDSVWLTSNMLESQLNNEETRLMYNAMNTMAAGEARVISSNNGSGVIQIVERKAINTKYNVAIVKCPVNFSTKTYQDALNKFNRFMGENQTLASIEKNAGKNGYLVRELNTFDKTNHNIGGVANTKDAVKWAFDEAEPGNVSKIYECGENRDHFVVVAVTKAYERGYMPWDNAEVKRILTSLVMKEKKADMLAQQASKAKNMDQAKKLKGAVFATLPAVTFTNNPYVTATSSSEPAIAGVVAKTAAGKFAGPVKGAGGVYMLQVMKKTKGTEKFDKESEMRRAANQNAYIMQNTLYFSLRQQAEVVDHRYKF